MIKHIWSVLCEKSIVNQDDNNITLSNIIEEIQVKIGIEDQKKVEELGFIGLPLNYEIVSLWVNSEGKQKPKAIVELILVDPKAVELNRVEQEINFANYKRMRSRFRMMGLKLTIGGRYLFKISIKEEGQKMFKVVCEIPLDVQIERSE